MFVTYARFVGSRARLRTTAFAASVDIQVPFTLMGTLWGQLYYHP